MNLFFCACIFMLEIEQRTFLKPGGGGRGEEIVALSAICNSAANPEALL